MTPARGNYRFAAAGVVAALALSAAAPPARASDVSVHGLMDLVLAGHSDADDLNLLWKGDSRFDTYTVRLFVDGAVTDRLQVHTQLLVSEIIGARAMGAYARFTPVEDRDLHVVAGLIPWIIGTFDARSYSDKNPLIGVPMMYQHQTTLRWDQVPPDADALLAKAGGGYQGVNYVPGGRAFPGMPVVYQHWWDFGVGVVGSARPFEFALGLENGTPSYPDPVRDQNASKSVLGRLGVMPTPGTRLGVSGAYGGYLVDALPSLLPAGQRVENYHQALAMADAEWSYGHVVVRAEAFRNLWETPTVGVLRADGGFVEAQITLPASFYVAGRYEILRFGDLRDSTGTARPWDSEWDRGEAGVGYRVTRGVLAKVVVQWNERKAALPAEVATTESLVAGQLSIRF